MKRTLLWKRARRGKQWFMLDNPNSYHVITTYKMSKDTFVDLYNSEIRHTILKFN